ncbi:hypothetical protein [Kitasatospora phosalacinea]|uniref:Uncharacterized protein n=1 Tax=Kitasatospora phosalacinea TaxID=2065 RepID=A0ABW6GF23_9ACTN
MDMSFSFRRTALYVLASLAFTTAATTATAATASPAPARSDSHSEAWTGIWMSGDQHALSEAQA